MFPFSDKFLDELELTYQLICQTQTESESVVQLQDEWREMQRQMKAMEQKLHLKQVLLSTNFSKIVAKQRAIETHRKTSLKMVSFCESIGRKLRGDDYK